MRSGLAVFLAAVAASVSLSACSTSGNVATVDGEQSLQISVPLSVAACEPAGLCFAVGTTGVDATPTSAAQVTARGDEWHVAATPASPSTFISTAACWDGGCLFGGSNAQSDVIWSTKTNTRIARTAAPIGGIGVNAISCFAVKSCAVLDASATGAERVSFTTDGGASWAAPITIPTVANELGTSIACVDPVHCVIAQSSSTGGNSAAAWTATNDAFATTYSGHQMPGGHPWTQLNNLLCSRQRCIGRLADAAGQSMVVVVDFARGQWFNGSPPWRSTLKLPFTVDVVACTPGLRCIATGTHGATGVAWASTGSTWSRINLRYVSDPLTGAACARKRCIAINDSTVLSFTP
jgi:hypothetical protein